MTSESLSRVHVSKVRQSLRSAASEAELPPSSEKTGKASAILWWEAVLAIIISAWAIWSGWQWITADQAPLFEHSGRFIRNSVVTWMRIEDGRGLKPEAYPPLAYLVSCLFYRFYGVSRQAALASQLVFYLPYVLGCWWLGRRIGGRWGGLLV
ncbi:hypothetical protein IJT17_09140, partial [bacterium]|nr:hypothetical protein [bacterium]